MYSLGHIDLAEGECFAIGLSVEEIEPEIEASGLDPLGIIITIWEE